MTALPTSGQSTLAQLIPSVVLALIATVALTSCRREPDSRVIARVGDVEIRVADLHHEARRWATSGAAGTDRKEVLDALIRRQTLVSYAQTLGLDQEPEVRRAYENLLIGRLKRQELEPRLRAVDLIGAERTQEAPQGTTNNTTAERRLAVLRLQLPPHASSERHAQLASRMAEARRRAAQMPLSTAGFGRLAGEFSDDPDTRHSGGDLGWFRDAAPDQRTDPAVLAAGFALHRPGDLSEVVPTPRGYFLVALMDLRSPGPEAQATEEARRRHALRQKKRREAEVEFQGFVRAKVPVTVYADALQQMDWPDDQPVLAQSNDNPPGVPSSK